MHTSLTLANANIKSVIINTLEILYNEIPCNKASLLRARHASP